jgi:hypothetical protein
LALSVERRSEALKRPKSPLKMGRICKQSQYRRYLFRGTLSICIRWMSVKIQRSNRLQFITGFGLLRNRLIEYPQTICFTLHIHCKANKNKIKASTSAPKTQGKRKANSLRSTTPYSGRAHNLCAPFSLRPHTQYFGGA